MTTRRELSQQARKALGGLTQRKFAALLGVGYVTVGRWEMKDNPQDPGAVGEALFHLILDSPGRSKRVLKRLQAEREA